MGLRITWPGSGAEQSALQGLTNLTNQQAQLYQQYLPGAMAGLQGLYTPGSPLYQQLNTLGQANAMNLQKQLANRGLGASSMMGNALSGYYSGLQNQNSQLALQGLQALAQLASGQGSAAAQGYGRMSSMGQQQYANMFSLLSLLKPLFS